MGFRVPCRALPQPPKAAACMWRELSLNGASVPQEPLKSSPFVESEHCNALPCLTRVLGSAGGAPPQERMETGQGTKAHRERPGPGRLLSWVCITHNKTEGRHTGPRSRRYRKAMGSQSACKGSKTQRLTQAQGTRFYSDFSQALPGEAEHFSHSMLMTEDLRHTSVSRDQQGDLLLSRLSCVRLCATPQTAAHQAPHPWDSPGKNTGVGCHFLLQCMKVKSESEVAQSWPTLSDPMDCSLLGSSVHGIFQARVLEWVPSPSPRRPELPHFWP